MKIRIQPGRDELLVKFQYGRMTIDPMGRCKIRVGTRKVCWCQTEGEFDFGECEWLEPPDNLEQDLLEDVRTALREWSRTEEGRDWLRYYGWGIP
jgi:hypothetical protein